MKQTEKVRAIFVTTCISKRQRVLLLWYNFFIIAFQAKRKQIASSFLSVSDDFLQLRWGLNLTLNSRLRYLTSETSFVWANRQVSKCAEAGCACRREIDGWSSRNHDDRQLGVLNLCGSAIWWNFHFSSRCFPRNFSRCPMNRWHFDSGRGGLDHGTSKLDFWEYFFAGRVALHQCDNSRPVAPHTNCNRFLGRTVASLLIVGDGMHASGASQWI